MEPPDALRAFRRSFYECLHRRSDALFELADAILTADSAVPSPVHLSLQTPHRRGWGSLYAALNRGRIDAETLRDLLAQNPLAAGVADEPPVYAVDVSVWPRCDAECSPQRGYYYHPSRHSAGQPIVAGWGLPVHRPTRLPPRELDRPDGRAARPPGEGGQRGSLRAGQGAARTIRRGQ
ncbi:MAG: transposase [Rubrobacter sp.]|nr:transposase [Rubrobacter sp.]